MCGVLVNGRRVARIGAQALDDEPRVLAVTWLLLSRAALCLNDEAIFDLSEGRCPACASEHFVLLARWLAERERL